MSVRLAFKGRRRGTVTATLKTVNSLYTMDARETALATKQGRTPVLFVSDGVIDPALFILQQVLEQAVLQTK